MDALIRRPRLGTQRLRLDAVPSAAVPAASPSSFTTGQVAAAAAAGAAAPVAASATQPRGAAPVAAVDPEALRREGEARARAALQAEFDQALRREREAARQEGLAEGRREGLAAAAEAARQQQAQHDAALRERLQALHAAGDAALRELQAHAADLAFAAVVRVAGARAASREFVLGQVEAVVRHAAPGQPLTLRLNPRDAAVMREFLGRTVQAPALPPLEVVDDEALALGGCIVEGPLERLDASLDTQLRLLCGLLAAGPAQEETP
jgi:flagellar assembly protein FliH